MALLKCRNHSRLRGERSFSVDHTTIYRWVQRYAPELEKRCRPHMQPTTDSYRVNETYIKIKCRWYYRFAENKNPCRVEIGEGAETVIRNTDAPGQESRTQPPLLHHKRYRWRIRFLHANPFKCRRPSPINALFGNSPPESKARESPNQGARINQISQNMRRTASNHSRWSAVVGLCKANCAINSARIRSSFRAAVGSPTALAARE